MMIECELTKVELAVQFLTVDDIEAVLDARPHVAHFEVEPLMVVVCVDVRTLDQVVLVLPNLSTSKPRTVRWLR